LWHDLSKGTAMKLGVSSRISKHGFLTAQIVRKPGLYDRVNTYFHCSLSCYNPMREIEYINDETIEPK
jgi:hypothetical protein